MHRTITRHVFMAAWWLSLGSFAALLPQRAAGQTSGSATINGAVTDASGAVVPAAELTIRNTDTGSERKTETSEAGIYNAAFLAPGHYEIRVAKTGFSPVLHTDLMLQVGQTLTINLSLAVQTAQQEVTVTGEAPVVDSEKIEVSQVVSETAVSNLPVSGRRWDTFVFLTPNVTTDGTSGMVSYRGLSGLYNSNTVDGANNNQALFSEARGRATSGVYVYSLDSIREYQVTDSSYSAELGQAAGGVVNAVTKSGTNTFHGDLFYYLRYPTWNALDPLPKSQGIYSQPIHQWQQFGLSFGGPLIQNRLFGFFTYDGSRKVNPITYTSTTYTPSFRALPCPTQLTSTQCSQANAFLGSLQGTYPRATNNDILFGKLNYQINSSNTLSASYDYANNSAPNGYSTAPTSNNDSIQTNGSYIYHERIFIANLDSAISGTMVNNVRFQWGRDLEVAGSNAPGPYVSLSNITNYGEFYALPRTAEPDEKRTQIADTLSIVRGRHTFKTGFDVNIVHEIMINLFQGTGRYTYSGTNTQAFNNWALDVFNINTGDGLTGKHYNTFVQVNDPITHVGKDDFWEKDAAGFFEDSWHATPKLTVSAGLRYDIFLIPAPPQPNTLTPLTTLYTSTINNPKKQFAPRVGVSWQLNPKTVFRAGGGLFYAKTTNTTYYNTRVENGVFQQTFNCTPTTCQTLTFPNLIWTPPGPTPAAPFAGAVTPQVITFSPPASAQASRGMAPDWKNPSAWSGDVTVERELPGGLSASAAYVFSRALHLPIFTDSNLAPATTTKSYDILTASGSTAQTYTVPFYTSRIDQGTGIITTAYPVVNSWYNSLVLTVRRPFRHGLEFTANYTLAKARDDGEVIGSNGTFAGSDIAVDPYNIRAEYAPSDLDQRHRFVANWVWMPRVKLDNRAAHWIVNGWGLSSILTFATGHPVQANISGTPSPLDGGLTAGDSSNASVTAGRAGWLSRNPAYAPGFKDWDLRLSREFGITERIRLQLLGELFNVTNSTNVLSVNTTAFTYLAPGSGACAGHTNACMTPSATFMAPTATSSLIFGPRQVQISGRLTF
jgi:outer membrane receptor protein involved in Fe transport